MDRIEEAHWEKLGSSRPSGEKLIARLPFPEKSERMFIAIDSAGLRHLVISLQSSDNGFEDTNSRGLRVATRELVLRGKDEGRYIDIVCVENAGKKILNSIADDILNGIVSSQSDAAEIVGQVLAKWRNFWGKLPKNILSLSEQMGLFSEIYFMRNWIIPNFGINAVKSWKGPWGNRHDFLFIGGSVEVKSTSSIQGRIFKISGLEQLSSAPNNSLHLFGLRLRHELGSEMTLYGEVEKCFETFKDNIDAVEHFEEGLIRAGYSPAHKKEYLENQWGIDEEALFLVNDDFPKLDTAMMKDGIPAGIEDIRYSINLNAYSHLIVARKPSDFVGLDMVRFE